MFEGEARCFMARRTTGIDVETRIEIRIGTGIRWVHLMPRNIAAINIAK
jgi:hypothetical protein